MTGVAEALYFNQEQKSIDDADNNHVTIDDTKANKDGDNYDNNKESTPLKDVLSLIAFVVIFIVILIVATVALYLFIQSRTYHIHTTASQWETEDQEVEINPRVAMQKLSCMDTRLRQSKMRCVAVEKKLELSKQKDYYLTSLLNEAMVIIMEDLKSQKRSATLLHKMMNELQTRWEQIEFELKFDEPEVKTIKPEYNHLQDGIAPVTSEKKLVEEKKKHNDELAKKEAMIKELEQKLKVAQQKLEEEEEVNRNIDKTYRDTIEKEQEKVKTLIETSEGSKKMMQNINPSITEITKSKLKVQQELVASEKENEEVKNDLKKHREELKRVKQSLHNA